MQEEPIKPTVSQYPLASYEQQHQGSIKSFLKGAMELKNLTGTEDPREHEKQPKSKMPSQSQDSSRCFRVKWSQEENTTALRWNEENLNYQPSLKDLEVGLHRYMEIFNLKITLGHVSSG